jgi:diguanylate cyclase (GGDEF)-like protein/PAS domain S-box-containing protein
MDIPVGPWGIDAASTQQRQDKDAIRWLGAISPYPVILANAEGVILHANLKACHLFGYEAEELLGQPVEILVPDASRSVHRTHRRAYFARPEERPMGIGRDLIGCDKHGRLIPIEVALVPLTLSRTPAVMATIVDLTVRKHLEGQLREERDLNDAIIDGLPGLFYLLDPSGRFIRWNHNLQRITGLTHAEITGIRATDLFKGKDRLRVEAAIEEVFRNGRHEIEASMRTAGNEYVPFHFSGVRVQLSGRTCLAGSGIDISSATKLRAELEFRATHDLLTGLVNRHRFEELLASEIERAKRYRGSFSVLMLDIDHFKRVNDRHGHPIGDLVLKQFAETLRPHLRATDTLARWGGEEFTLLLPSTPATEARVLAENLRERIGNTRMPVQGNITISIGMTEYRPPETLHELLRRVDAALYEAKERGRDRVVEN